MEFNSFEKVGCRQTATKNTIKTAQIQTSNTLEATRHPLEYCGSCSSVWPKDNKKNNKINTQHQLRLLLITMAVLTAFLQMPRGATAAAMRDKDARHLPDSSISSMSIDDFVEIGLNDHDVQYSSSPYAKRTRLHKRHSENLFIQHHLEESATDLEWVNPCNGFFEPSTEDSNSFVPPASYFLKNLRRELSTEFHHINHTMKAINITDLGTYGKLKKFYSFLPKIKKNSRLNLKTWYSGVQTYVATFAHLGRMQYKFDHAKRMYASELTHELNQLLLSARSILCQIETTINGSYPFPANQPKLNTFTREAMNARLKFLTYERAVHRHQQENVLLEPEMVDLQFAKLKYFYYLRRMWRAISNRTRRIAAKKHLGSSDLSSSKSKDSISASDEQNLSSSHLDSISRLIESGSLEFSAEYGSHAGRSSSHNQRNKRQRKST